MPNIRKQGSEKPVLPVEPPSATMSIYDRFPSPREDGAPAPQQDRQARQQTLVAATEPAAGTPAAELGPDDGPTDFVIGRGTRLKGEIEAAGDVIVEGEVQASIRASTVRIAASGSVAGEVDAANAEVRGRFEGTLNVRECLTVSGNGHVSGTVRYGELKVDRGARITGDIALVDGSPATHRPAQPSTKPAA